MFSFFFLLFWDCFKFFSHPVPSSSVSCVLYANNNKSVSDSFHMSLLRSRPREEHADSRGRYLKVKIHVLLYSSKDRLKGLRRVVSAKQGFRSLFSAVLNDISILISFHVIYIQVLLRTHSPSPLYCSTTKTLTSRIFTPLICFFYLVVFCRVFFFFKLFNSSGFAPLTNPL